MFLGKRFVLMNQAPAEGSAGGTNGMGQSPQTAGGTPPTPPAQAPGQSTNALDFYGSQTPPPAAPPAPGGQSQPPAAPGKPATPAPVGNASGYGNEPPPPAPAAATPPAPAAPPATPPVTPPPAGDPPATPPATPAEAFKTLNVEGVDATYVESFKNFAHSNKFTPEQAQALFDLKKSEMEAQGAETTRLQAEHQAKIQSTRQAWGAELRADPSFGGQNFDNNVHLVNKYISEFLPETNKHLTTNKTMLPPYVMRDLHRNALEAYKTDTFVNGAEGDTTSALGDNYDPLAFYKEKQN